MQKCGPFFVGAIKENLKTLHLVEKNKQIEDFFFLVWGVKMIQKFLNLKKKLINIHMMSEGYAKFALRWVKLIRYGQKAIYEACMSFTHGAKS